MEDFMSHINKFALELVYVAVAAIGGIARYLQIYLETGEFKFKRFVAHTFVSAFSGVMFGEAGLFFGLENVSLFLLVGMGGYMGAETLKLIERNLEKRVKNKK